MKGETFTSEVVGESREACRSAALAEAREYFGEGSELEIVQFEAQRIPNPERDYDSPVWIYEAKVRIVEKAKAKAGQLWAF